MTVNKVILIGNLGRDPELRTTGSGTTVANLRIATTERRKDRDGNWNDHTEWHSIVVFGRQAENVGQYLRKGRQVYIEGRLTTRKWQDRDGRDRWTTEVVADQVKFLSSGDRGGDRGSYGGGGGGGGGYNEGGYGQQGGRDRDQASQDAAPSGNGEVPFQGDDDIPF